MHQHFTKELFINSLTLGKWLYYETKVASNYISDTRDFELGINLMLKIVPSETCNINNQEGSIY